MKEENQASQTVLKSTEELKKAADRITVRNTLFSAGAGLIPFPAVDAAILLGIQLNMIRSISRLYNVEFKENLVKSLIGALIGSVGTAGVMKVIPGLGTVLGGLTTSATAAAATYATGKVFTQHFDQGGTLLDFDPVKSREFFEKEFEAGRMFVSDVTEVEEEVKKEKKGMFGNLFSSKKKEQEETERVELIKTNRELTAAVAELKEQIDALKKG
ncbi:MAG: DUF697 domain-containing protein [Phaeodactylibacter sp.]|nr:DUF697 domain-containing protein [Phaeodactylibacter sp.]MCB0614595.1 DUF697 domain-containing protein [Phaeodactylibacter sp.]MCB9304740.1 DUF697 domain-containing protein [Lewinellaceae bacterium]